MNLEERFENRDIFKALELVVTQSQFDLIQEDCKNLRRNREQNTPGAVPVGTRSDCSCHTWDGKRWVSDYERMNHDRP